MHAYADIEPTDGTTGEEKMTVVLVCSGTTQTMEAQLLKILIPIGPFHYGDTSHALSDGFDPPMIRGNGGLRHHRTTGRGGVLRKMMQESRGTLRPLRQ